MKVPAALMNFARTSGTMALLYAASTALSFLVGTLLARLLGPAGYGAYALAMTAATLAGIVTEFGLPVLAMRETGVARASGEWGGLKGLLGWSDRVIIALSLVMALASWAWFGWRMSRGLPVDGAALAWGVAMIPLVALGKMRSWVLLAMGRTFASQFPVMLLRPLLFIAGCLLVWRIADVLTPARAMAVQAAGAAVVLGVIFTQFMRMRPAGLAAAEARIQPSAWLAACLPMGLTEGLRLLQGQIGLLLTGALAGAGEAGLYRVADSATQITVFAASIAGTAATPMFARMWSEGDRRGLEQVVLASALMALCGGFLLGLPLLLFGKVLFPWVFGPGFAASAQIFVVLWSGSLAFACFGLCQAAANMTGQHVLSTQSFGVIALINLGLGVVLIPRSGAMGAAFSSAIASACGALYCAIVLRRRNGINATVFNPHLAGVISGWLRARREGQVPGGRKEG